MSYDGGRYAGWQRQAGFDSIQERLERAIAVLGESVVVHGAGRTDAGVHALRQCAHIRLERRWAPTELVRALNGNLPADIAVRSVREVPASFHARFSATAKRYAYRFAVAPIRPVFARDRAHWVRGDFAIDAMREAARALVGRHDFAAFASNPGYERKRGTVRTIHHLHLIRRPFGVDLVVQGDGFLYNMVRAIAGTLKQVGLRRCEPFRVRDILESKDRRQAGATLEPGGLYLVRVVYPASAMLVSPDTARLSVQRSEPEQA